jgi:HPt (histidine-containing phosphotransfer) domain-containing protein
MNDHIAKPIRPQILFEALLKWISHGDRTLPETFYTAGPEVDDVTLPELPGIDVEDGLERLGGNKASYIRLLQKFSSNQAQAISSIEEALAADDQELAVRLAHTLKGVSGSIGATDLAKSATKLETTIKEQSDGDMADLLAETGAELQRIIDLIENIDAGKSPSKSGEPKELPENLEQDLRRLLEQLEDYDSAAEDAIFEILEAVNGTPVYEMLLGIKKHIGKYDLETAASELEPLIQQICGENTG